MRRVGPGVGVALLTLFTILGSGCARAAAEPTPAPKAAPLVTQVAAATPAPKASASPPPESKPSWEETVAAAKREGKLAIFGPVGTDVRESLTESFQRRYPEIQVEFTGMRGAEAPARVLSELGAGQFLTDLLISGTTSVLDPLLPGNALQPILPFLVGPDGSDPSRWRGGKFEFGDEAERYNLVWALRLQVPFYHNPQLVPSADFVSWKDLLNPKWKSQIVILDPRQAGGGHSTASFWLATEGLGKEYIRNLFTSQDVLLMSDDRLILDAVARGQRPIAIGPSGVLVNEYRNKGLPVDFFPGALREGTYVSASNASAAIVRGAPHPNAIKVYLDHLLSRDPQLEYSKATGLTSLRRDVPREHLIEFLVPKEGVKYHEDYKERNLRLKGELVEFLGSVLPS